MKNPAVLYLISREFLELSITRKDRHQTATEIMLRPTIYIVVTRLGKCANGAAARAID
jgi:hypothetical protein